MKYEAIIFDYANTLAYANTLQMPEENKSLVKELYEKGYRLAIISNSDRYGDGLWLRAKLESESLLRYFEVVISSAVIGLSKPDPAIFENTIKLMNIPPGRCLMVGDSINCDINGANRIGMDTLYVDLEKKIWIENLKRTLEDTPRTIKLSHIKEFELLSIKCSVRHLSEELTNGDSVLIDGIEYEIQNIGPFVTKDQMIHGQSSETTTLIVKKTTPRIPLSNIKIITEHPIALSSRDHINPHGTKQDNSVNLNFNIALAKIKPSPISILDLGCAGGGMVKSFVDQGDFAVGIEGSDYSLKIGRAEWATIPGNLFTADITKPFQVLSNGKPHLFDVITAWEFMEHIETKDLKQVFSNIEQHLYPDGLFIASINTNDEYYHRTVQPKEWWIDFIKEQTSFVVNDILSRFENNFVRYGDKRSFHVVLQLK